MKPVIFFPVLLLIVGIASASSPVREISLGTNASSAYTAHKGPLIQGGSIEHIDCIFKDLQQPYQIARMPWLRARQEVLKANLDGFFTAIPTADANDYASLSAPLVLESWYWFWRADMPEPESWKGAYKPGAILGSQQAEWLDEAGYPAPMKANNLPQMLKLLFSKRIDVILADKEHFEKAAAELGVTADNYQYRFFRYVPLGVYFGKTFLAENPEFLSRFNQHIFPCAPEAFQIAEDEREKITRLISPLMQTWTRLPTVIDALVEQHEREKNTDQLAILEKDDLWQHEFRTKNFSFPAALLSTPLSQQLRQLKAATQGLVSEIILMDSRGSNLAISDITTDYWQGDEAKYLLVFNRSAEQLFFEAAVYDESTQRFQVHVSLPIYAKDIETSIGVLTVGVDIEKALSLLQ